LWYPDIVFQKQREELIPSAIQYGNAFHLVIAEVKTSLELTEVVERLVENGEIEASFKDRLIHDAHVFLQKADELGLSRSVIETLNETDILADENILIRPDKIWVSEKEVNVIEIKTGIANPSHVAQLKMYQGALEQIFTKRVNAYLYYVTSKEFLPV
jgi:CRISPR/Cas system-associated exonuclease Cas4 (RecB family)